MLAARHAQRAATDHFEQLTAVFRFRDERVDLRFAAGEFHDIAIAADRERLAADACDEAVQRIALAFDQPDLDQQELWADLSFPDTTYTDLERSNSMGLM